MKVLFISNNSGGMYSFRKEVIEAASKQAETFLCVPDDIQADYWETIGCKYIQCRLDGHGTNPINDYKLLKQYKTIMAEIKPDIVFTYTIKPNVYGGMACQSLKIPYVANITGLGTALENEGPVQKISINLYKQGLKKAQKVFFQNADNQAFFIHHHIYKGRYDLLPGSGVNLEQYHVLPYPQDKPINFVFIARIMKEKGIDQYLDAAKAIRAAHPETCFHICGVADGYYKSLIEQYDRDKTIIYHGPVSNMEEIYRMAACTIHPTYYPEGMSNVLLESAASGRPIITTDRSGCKEVIQDSINGFIVKQKDSEDLVRQIEKFLSLTPKQREEMGRKGRELVEWQFDRKIVVQKYLDEIETVRKQKCAGQ